MMPKHFSSKISMQCISVESGISVISHADLGSKLFGGQTLWSRLHVHVYEILKYNKDYRAPKDNICQNIFLSKSQCNVSVLNQGSVLLVMQIWGQNVLVGKLYGPDYMYEILKYNKDYRAPKDNISA